MSVELVVVTGTAVNGSAFAWPHDAFWARGIPAATLSSVRHDSDSAARPLLAIDHLGPGVPALTAASVARHAAIVRDALSRTVFNLAVPVAPTQARGAVTSPSDGLVLTRGLALLVRWGECRQRRRTRRRGSSGWRRQSVPRRSLPASAQRRAPSARWRRYVVLRAPYVTPELMGGA